MRIYFAPLEGLTDATFRRVHHQLFSGVDAYYIPFISPSNPARFTQKALADVLPAANDGMPVIPQILTNDADAFVEAAKMLRDFGYSEVNLNLGCPSSTVTAKEKGSGLLRNPPRLRAFLDSVFTCSPLPVSIKTRVGYESTAEWPALLQIYREYPIHELIIHPRTKIQVYRGKAEPSLCNSLHLPFSYAYNGDVFTKEDADNIISTLPDASALMLGRGLVSNPLLASQIKGRGILTMNALADFHDALYQEYLRIWPESAVIGRMHKIVSFLLCCLDYPSKQGRILRKASTPQEYENAIHDVFASAALKETPAFRPESGGEEPDLPL